MGGSEKTGVIYFLSEFLPLLCFSFIVFDRLREREREREKERIITVYRAQHSHSTRKTKWMLYSTIRGKVCVCVCGGGGGTIHIYVIPNSPVVVFHSAQPQPQSKVTEKKVKLNLFHYKTAQFVY